MIIIKKLKKREKDVNVLYIKEINYFYKYFVEIN